MAYTGNGTQTEPYIVDNWKDLKTVSATEGVYVRLDPDAECKVMDINLIILQLLLCLLKQI